MTMTKTPSPLPERDNPHPWIFCDGGDAAPVPAGTLVDLKYRNGDFASGLVGQTEGEADDWRRGLGSLDDADPYDIIAYRISGEAPADERPVKPWFLIIDPPQYDDSEDAGYAWGGEAPDEDTALRFACVQCEIDNGWAEASINPASVKVIEAGPNWHALYTRLAAEAGALADLTEGALTTHIYHLDNGDEIPADSAYVQAIAAVRAAIVEA